MLRHIRRLKENPGVIFKIPKKHEEGEPKSVLSLLTGGGPAFPMIAGVALAFFIVFAIGAAFVLGKASDAMSQTVETIEVDDFEGRNYDATLAEALENSDKYTVKIEYEYSDAYEAGVIMEQSPAAGSSKKVKVELTLTVCSGNREIDMPSLSDYNYKAAIKELRNRGLDYAIEYKKDNIRSSGQVISTSPAAGEKVKVGSTVTVYVCDGFEDGDIKVPDFVGMTEKKAFKKLVELDLLPGAVSYVKDKADRGTVIKQSVEKDKEVLPNTRIGLTISGGPDYDPANPDGTTAPEETTEPPETTAPDTTTVDTTDAETTEAETTDPVTEDTTDSETTGDGAAEETTGPADNESADNSQSN